MIPYDRRRRSHKRTDSRRTTVLRHHAGRGRPHTTADEYAEGRLFPCKGREARERRKGPIAHSLFRTKFCEATAFSFGTKARNKIKILCGIPWLKSLWEPLLDTSKKNGSATHSGPMNKTRSYTCWTNTGLGRFLPMMKNHRKNQRNKEKWMQSISVPINPAYNTQ